jgi:hypothetical protein
MWGARAIEADAELLAVELVRYSIQTCSATTESMRRYEPDHLHIIQVRLLGFKRTISIEVWDTTMEPVGRPARHSRLQGLGLVNARAKDWGSSFTPQGRVLWCELDVF